MTITQPISFMVRIKAWGDGSLAVLHDIQVLQNGDVLVDGNYTKSQSLSAEMQKRMRQIAEMLNEDQS